MKRLSLLIVIVLSVVCFRAVAQVPDVSSVGAAAKGAAVAEAMDDTAKKPATAEPATKQDGAGMSGPRKVMFVTGLGLVVYISVMVYQKKKGSKVNG